MTQTHVSMGVAKTVLEVADVAWTVVERCQHHRHHHVTEPLYPGSEGKAYSDMESLRSENQSIRLLLETNLTLVQQMSTSPTLLQECPSDLHKRLLAAVNSESFLNELENLREKSMDVASCKFPFEAPSALTKALGDINKWRRCGTHGMLERCFIPWLPGDLLCRDIF